MSNMVEPLSEIAYNNGERWMTDHLFWQTRDMQNVSKALGQRA